MEMLLPGGVADSHGLSRAFAFRQLTGGVELAVADCTRAAAVYPDMVTDLLSRAVEYVGGRQADRELVAGLCVGDRQFLMSRLIVLMGKGACWLTAPCAACDTDFDFHIDLSRLPIKAAADGYPHVELETALGRCLFRLPTGTDQSAIASLPDEDEARRALLKRCLVSVDGKAPAASGPVFDADDMARIDAAMEDIAPEIAMQASIVCPECGDENAVDIDLRHFLNGRMQDIYTEVHTLAWHYHWAEAEILNMPRIRRRHYLSLIDRARGMHEQPEGSGQ